ncbi:alpha/beta hydrolase [Nocardia sp. CS682]|uniref:alpha/beta hydrolase n=1 Tax=Nocardia sp. CS682 TaxID=1047172 RepID=UPI0010750C99|nr:alpha/beta hydrolase [Nocardia sp. CS682]QBS39257.1 alpha/beta hydrolase [Nocardia sp. CS682]
MNFRGPALAAAAAIVACLTAAAPATAADLSRLPGVVDIPCAATTLHQGVDWYLPTGVPKGMVWIQHGFARTHSNVAQLATTFAAGGYLVFAPALPFIDLAGCTLQNLGDNTRFLDSVARLFGTAADPEGALSRSLAAAAADAGRLPPPLPRDFVFVGHSAGAEAVEFVAHRLHVAYPDTWHRLRGLVLLDPVKSFLGDNTDRALADLDPTDLPILTIAAQPSLCNNLGSGTDAVQHRLNRPFLGIRLGNGLHTDAEGTSSDSMGNLLCGTPDVANTSVLQVLARGWSDDFIAGTKTADYYPATTAEAVTAAPAVAAAPAATILPAN